jgi:adenylate cyclase
MSDVFISYARSTAKVARAIAEGLRVEGYSVWWDEDLPNHRAYSDVIEEQLATAKAVVVIWSAEAAKSQWVRSEANRAREDDKLVQIAVDASRLPMPFDQTQCADLAGWTADAAHPGWRKVLASIADIVGGDVARVAPIAARPAPALPDKPSIAVLPFADLSQARDQDYFCDGMVVEIVTALSKFQSLFVIASGSSLACRDAAGRLAEVASELGVRYLLQGAVRKAGERMRITVQLIDAPEAAQIWAERFDGTLEDVFALQDEVSNAVATQIAPTIQASEIRRAAARPTQDLGAYDCYLRGLHLYQQFSPEAWARGLVLLEQAIARDPGYALALALAASLRGGRIIMGWSADAAADAEAALELRARALRAGGDDAEVLAWAALAGAWAGADKATSAALADRAMARNSGSAGAWMASGWLRLYGGQAPMALEAFGASLRLDPCSAWVAILQDGIAMSLFFARRFDEAVPALKQAADLLPSAGGNFTPMIVAALAHDGRLAEARAALKAMRPHTLDAFLPFLEPRDRELLLSGVALASVED